MAFVTKTWKDRLVEYAGRRKLKNVATGEEILMDVSRSEGTVNQAGDAFSAANMNNLEQRIKTEFDSVNSSLANGDISFSVESDGAYVSYKVGADSVTKKLGSEPKTVAFSNVTLSNGSTETRTLNSSYGTLLYAVITSMSYLYKGSESYTGYVSQSISGNTVTFKCTCGGGVVSATVSGYFVYV